MHCPVCKQPLQNLIKDCFVCKNGDGVLITSSHLVDKDEQLVNKIDPAAYTAKSPLSDQSLEITCPHCASIMHRVDYSFTGIIIDSCLKCHYRWLDRGELRKIKDHKPKFKPEDSALLMSIEKEIDEVWQEKEVNPPYRLNNNFTFGSSKTLGLTALHAIFIGLRHSKFMRIVTITIIVVTALMYYYVIRDF